MMSYAAFCVEMKVPLPVLVMVRFGASTVSVAAAVTLPGLLLGEVVLTVSATAELYTLSLHDALPILTLAPEARLPRASVRVPPLMVPASLVQVRWVESGSGSLR